MWGALIFSSREWILQNFSLEQPPATRRGTQSMNQAKTYLVDKLNSVVPLHRLDGHSSGIDQLGQVYGLRWIHPSQINQVLQSFQRQRRVLRTPTWKEQQMYL